MAPVELDALKKLLDYNRCDEETHFEECMYLITDPEEALKLIQTHIHTQIQVLDAFVERWNGSSISPKG